MFTIKLITGSIGGTLDQNGIGGAIGTGHKSAAKSGIRLDSSYFGTGSAWCDVDGAIGIASSAGPARPRCGNRTYVVTGAGGGTGAPARRSLNRGHGSTAATRRDIGIGAAVGGSGPMRRRRSNREYGRTGDDSVSRSGYRVRGASSTAQTSP